MNLDIFKSNGPTSLSFSGGRTSAYMLWLTLQAHGGALPGNMAVTFANTGKEHPKTLDFVAACGREWNVPIAWVEWRDGDPRYAVVEHHSASRNGEPFAAIIAKRQYPPNPLMRYCTQELKIRTMQRYLKDARGWNTYTAFVGLRADEPSRVATLKAACGRKQDVSRGVAPLAAIGVTVDDVGAFWAKQPFDLGIESHLGNCTLCHLKAKKKLLAVLRDMPGEGEWWAAQEASVGKTFLGPKRFRGLGYAGFIEAVAAERRGDGPADGWHKQQPWAHDAVTDDGAFDDLSELECGCTD